MAVLFSRSADSHAIDVAHSVSFVDVEPSIRLEVLDWGGTGPSLILLAGLNNTAHVFDAFAPLLVARFHVRAITRRGFGASSRPPNGYDTHTLALDVINVMNALSIHTTVLVGHSIAGDELTRIAATQRDRVRALVYLDAAYDRTKQPQNLPSPDQPTSPDEMRSMATLQARWSRVFGWTLPDDEARAQIVVDAQGRPERSTISTEVVTKILDGVEGPSYARVECPALAIYALDTIESMFPDAHSFNAENRQRAQQQVAALRRWQAGSIAQFKRGMRRPQVVTFEGANHYVFLTRPSQVIQAMDRFMWRAIGR